MNDSIHSGHRERMFQKLSEMPYSLNDHEILEIALFFSIPRKNTNPIAHALLNTFGTLTNVFDATKEELMEIEGIGHQTACNIKAMNEIIKRIIDQRDNLISERFSYVAYRNKLAYFFEPFNTEKFIVLLLDKKQKIIKKICFDSDFINKVEIDMAQLTHEIALAKPYSVILIHNHPSGIVLPTDADDHATGKIALALSLHGVRLYDHIVVTKDNSYSYYYDGRLDDIFKKYNLEQIMKKI